MYFPFFKLHGWGKRPIIQPKTIYSEVPKVLQPEYAKYARIRNGSGVL